MKILTLSDRVEPILHDQFDRRQFADVDLVLACGDLPPEYLSFVSGKLNVPLYFVRGNHDLRYDAGSPQGCINLADGLVQFKGKNILGLEGSRWYNGGLYQYTEAQMGAVIRRLRPKIWWHKGIDVVVTHAPPRHIHDAEDLCHRGFKSFRRLIDKYHPKYFIHGHIHRYFSDPGERVTIVDATKVVNTYGYNILEIKAGPKGE